MKQNLNQLIVEQQEIQKRNSPKTEVWQNAEKEIDRLIAQKRGFTAEAVAIAGREGGLPQAVADVFCDILREWLTADEMETVIARNSTAEYEGCCASHDFCDSNEAMGEAFKKVTGRECLMPCDEPPEEMIQADCDLMNAAWDLAKKQNFKRNS